MPVGQQKLRARPGVKVAAATDVGCQRENNEDSYLYWEPAGDTGFQQKGRLAIVADGMGGHEGGQDASRIATETIKEVYETSTGGPQDALLDGFKGAHEKVIEYATQHPQLRGMGTTATAIALRGNHLFYAHIGDSRLYRLHEAKLTRVTRDHSYVGRLFENGVISAEEAEVHPQRHILTAALGTGPEFTPDSPEQPIPLDPGDILLLCTDGLWGVVGDREIQQTIASNDVNQACRKLIERARERGGPDNITAILLRLE
jgi:PPM family protein phosphatase